MIITLVTTDLPNTCGFVGPSLLQTHLQHIKPEGLGSFLHSQTQPIRSVLLSHIHKGLIMLHKKASTTLGVALDDRGTCATGGMQNQIHCDLNVSFFGLSRLLFEKWIAFNVYKINLLPIFF